MAVSEYGSNSSGELRRERRGLDRAAATRRAFRGWRRTRPFWGGLLLIFSGVELLAIPLSSILARGSIKLTVYIGIGGVFGVLIGVLLAACGILMWLHPAHRVFYSIAAVLLAVVSFIVTNLGGFFIGMLLGMVGASLSYAWVPDPDVADPDSPGPGDAQAGAHRLLAVATPLAVLALGVPAHPASSAGPAVTAQKSCIIPIPILCPGPSPSPSPTASPGPTASAPAPSPSGSPAPTVSGSASPAPTTSAAPSPGPTRSRKVRKASAVKAAPPALQVSVAQFTLLTGSALLQGTAYAGVARVPAAGHRTIDMLKFTMSSLTLSGNPTLTVSENGATTSTSASSMQFTGNIVLYATKLSGDLAGVPITLTPNSPLSLILKVLKSVTPLVPLRLTNVSTDEPYISTSSLQIGSLQSSPR